MTILDDIKGYRGRKEKLKQRANDVGTKLAALEEEARLPREIVRIVDYILQECSFDISNAADQALQKSPPAYDAEDIMLQHTAEKVIPRGIQFLDARGQTVSVADRLNMILKNEADSDRAYLAQAFDGLQGVFTWSDLYKRLMEVRGGAEKKLADLEFRARPLKQDLGDIEAEEKRIDLYLEQIAEATKVAGAE